MIAIHLQVYRFFASVCIASCSEFICFYSFSIFVCKCCLFTNNSRNSSSIVLSEKELGGGFYSIVTGAIHLARSSRLIILWGSSVTTFYGCSVSSGFNFGYGKVNLWQGLRLIIFFSLGVGWIQARCYSVIITNLLGYGGMYHGQGLSVTIGSFDFGGMYLGWGRQRNHLTSLFRLHASRLDHIVNIATLSRVESPKYLCNAFSVLENECMVLARQVRSVPRAMQFGHELAGDR